jgi:choline kinase
MKAIILSAGQGTRLLPYTASTPKCLLPVQDQRPLLGVQLRALASAGIEDVTVVTGFRAPQVDAYLWQNPVPDMRVRTIYNRFFECADNLISCWQARGEMQSDFMILNGDTLFSPRVIRRLLAAPPAPITLTIDAKPEYDDDDMKVELSADGRVTAVAKTLDPTRSDGESIGMMSFRGEGPRLFGEALDDMVWRPSASRAYYLSTIDRLAATGCVHSVSIEGLWWGEVDTPEDLLRVRSALGSAAPVCRPDRRPASGYASHPIRMIH